MSRTTLTHPKHPSGPAVECEITRTIDDAGAVTYTATEMVLGPLPAPQVTEHEDGTKNTYQPPAVLQASGRSATGDTKSSALRALAAVVWPEKSAPVEPAKMRTQNDSAVTP